MTISTDKWLELFDDIAETIEEAIKIDDPERVRSACAGIASGIRKSVDAKRKQLNETNP